MFVCWLAVFFALNWTKTIEHISTKNVLRTCLSPKWVFFFHTFLWEQCPDLDVKKKKRKKKKSGVFRWPISIVQFDVDRNKTPDLADLKCFIWCWIRLDWINRDFLQISVWLSFLLLLQLPVYLSESSIRFKLKGPASMCQLSSS